MSRQISVLVYGDCPELQSCDLNLTLISFDSGNLRDSIDRDITETDLAIIAVDGNDAKALQFVGYLHKVAPSCATIMVAPPESLGLVRKAIEGGLTDYVLRAGVADHIPALLTHSIERALRTVYIKERFHESERRFWTFFDNCPLGLVVMDLAGRIEHANPVFAETLGYSLDALRAMHHSDIIEEEDEIWQALREELESGERDFLRLDQKLRHKNGDPRWVSFASVAMRDSNGVPAYLLGMVTDNTDRKRIQDNLKHADKMQAMGRLAGGVAHDFNNLLTIVNSHCFIMHDALEEPEKLTWSIERIMTATNRGSKLTRQLLTFGRYQAETTETVNPNEVLDKMRVVLESLFGKSVRVHLALGDDLRKININRSQLEQLLMNLALNARDAMPDGGRFTVRTYNLDVSVPSSAVPAELPHGQFTVLEICDTGIGMSPMVQKQAFEPFFTTKDVGEGTGLGLSTAYGVVTQHEGHITVDSKEAQGTTFQVYFPSSNQHSKTPPKLRRARRGTPTNGTETILLVEDEEELRLPLKQLLEAKGYYVIDAANAEEALTISRKHPDHIDLLLTDVIMPGIDGVSLADTLTDDRPETSVILMSGYTADTLSMRPAPPRERKLLQKPFGIDILSRTIRHMLKMP